VADWGARPVFARTHGARRRWLIPHNKLVVRAAPLATFIRRTLSKNQAPVSRGPISYGARCTSDRAAIVVYIVTGCAAVKLTVAGLATRYGETFVAAKRMMICRHDLHWKVRTFSVIGSLQVGHGKVIGSGERPKESKVSTALGKCERGGRHVAPRSPGCVFHFPRGILRSVHGAFFAPPAPQEPVDENPALPPRMAGFFVGLDVFPSRIEAAI
jgi:hypothetical protein